MDTVISILSPLAAHMARWPLWARAAISLAAVLAAVFALSRILPALLAGFVKLYYIISCEWLFSVTRGSGNPRRVLRRNARAEWCEKMYSKLLPQGGERKRKPLKWIALYCLALALVLLPSWAGSHVARKNMSALSLAVNAYHTVEAPILRRARRADPLGSESASILRDVRAQNPDYDAVQFVYARGLMTGNEDAFRPDDALTRGEMAFVLYRLSGEPVTHYRVDISDMHAGMRAYNAVQWCIEQGILSLAADGSFSHRQEITCEQAMAALFRYAENEGQPVYVSYDLSGTPGSENLHSWAAEAYQWAVTGGFAPADGSGALNPRQPLSRSAAARLFYQYCIWMAGLGPS